ncbi:DUF4224 domain-containing protein [Ferrimonas sediminicola]|uniref:DUF4224 domain-containing protein n=1 Tax=Ferrimonas sediminicola TaxID=2569538 RepID=A0A4U1B9L9_9GAMM|nr:DUF4224 domain-containing protein [Ferrimonas sediminicola]
MSIPFLTSQSLYHLTGYIQPAAQRCCLDRNGIKYVEGQDGHFATTWGAVEAALRVLPGSSVL